jgi:hypothetical protein
MYDAPTLLEMKSTMDRQRSGNSYWRFGFYYYGAQVCPSARRALT